MTWRIRESGHGGFVAEKGFDYTGENRSSCIMPTFIVYESASFPTRKQAQAYIDRNRKF